MRILDKNTDYYDYLANIYIDNTITFDRRDSFKLTKEEFMKYLYYGNSKFGWANPEYVLLQVHHTFWLMEINVTETNQYDRCKNYELTLDAKWNNYNSDDKLIELSVISFNAYMYSVNAKTKQDRINAVNNKQFKTWHIFNEHKTYKGYYGKPYKGRDVYEYKHIPIMIAIGISDFVNPLDVYLALEEYFKNQIEANERRDPIGTTDNDKVAMHGFDDKSFRKEKEENKKRKKII